MAARLAMLLRNPYMSKLKTSPTAYTKRVVVLFLAIYDLREC